MAFAPNVPEVGIDITNQTTNEWHAREGDHVSHGSGPLATTFRVKTPFPIIVDASCSTPINAQASMPALCLDAGDTVPRTGTCNSWSAAVLDVSCALINDPCLVDLDTVRSVLPKVMLRFLA
jgi:hypothetical protein